MLTCGKCADGWICEEHPDLPWPHDNCLGPGVPCDVPTCPYRIDTRPVHTYSGLVCPTCREPVERVADDSGLLVFQCPHCGQRWSVDMMESKPVTRAETR
jgi:DNA-directed RNA polymerase subunit RPC12/RpoP